MRRWLFCSLLVISATVSAQAAEPVPTTVPPPVESVSEPEAPPARTKPVERPVTKAVEKPSSPRPAPAVKVDKPAKPVATPKPAKPAAAAPKPAETPKTADGNKPAEPVATAPHPAPADSGSGFGCWTLAFAMLIAGFAAGFFWRHQMSRHKLGGMTVRIGTWRGIP